MMTVNLGTCAQETTVTIFAPSRALRAELDEVRALQRRLGEQDPVVRDDADRIAQDPREAGDERGAVARLELVEVAGVDVPGDDLAHVVGLPDVGVDDA